MRKTILALGLAASLSAFSLTAGAADAQNTTDYIMCPGDVLQVIRELAGEAECRRICVENPQMVVAGERIEVEAISELVSEKKGFWSRLFG